jgi:Flp pilus assembly protein TadB
MTRSTKLWFEVAAYAITITALLAIAALAIRLGAGLAITASMFTALFCVFVGIAVERRRTRRRDPASMSRRAYSPKPTRASMSSCTSS